MTAMPSDCNTEAVRGVPRTNHLLTSESSASQRSSARRSSKKFRFMQETAAKWQWQHRTGFRDYSKEENDRIERHYREGVWMMRMKTGQAHKAKPREIFFHDMIQYDPASDTSRSIRRLPQETRWQRFRRRINTIWYAVSNGKEKPWKPVTKAMIDKVRKEADDEVRREEEIDLLGHGRFARIVASGFFQVTSIIMIIFNCIWIVVDAEKNKGTSDLDTLPVFIAMDNIFCFWFTIELFIRFCAFAKKKYCLQDGWFLLDACLVVVMIVETWCLQLVVLLFFRGSSRMAGIDKLSVLRGLRLLRLSRLSRLFKIFPQLMVLLKGLTQAMKSLVFTLILTFVLTFMFAVVLKNLADQDPGLQALQLDSVSNCLWMLITYGTFLDSVGQMMSAEGPGRQCARHP